MFLSSTLAEDIKFSYPSKYLLYLDVASKKSGTMPSSISGFCLFFCLFPVGWNIEKIHFVQRAKVMTV